MPAKLMNFELPKGQSSIIKVIGVGGGGSNAVNHMYNEGIKGVDFVVCNTDAQALDNSPVPNKIQLGAGLTEGLGAGGDPEVGKNSALENIEQIKEILEKNTQMVFVTAGMGGGTGTGGAPVIASIARELNILTVGIVTIPFSNEGPKRRQQAEEGLERLRQTVDALLIICNDKLREMYGNLTLSRAFHQADDVLTTAARGIAEMVSVHGKINVDFRDVNTVMKDSGVAIMGSASAEGENRAIKAVELALASPLLNDNKIKGARYVLLNITTGVEEPLLDEITEISDFVQGEAGNTANVIMGVGTEEALEDKLSVTIIAAGFDTNPDLGFVGQKEPERIVRSLDEVEKPSEEDLPIVHELTPEEPEGEDEVADTSTDTLVDESEDKKDEITLVEPEAAKEETKETIESETPIITDEVVEPETVKEDSTTEEKEVVANPIAIESETEDKTNESNAVTEEESVTEESTAKEEADEAKVKEPVVEGEKEKEDVKEESTTIHQLEEEEEDVTEFKLITKDDTKPAKSVEFELNPVAKSKPETTETITDTKSPSGGSLNFNGPSEPVENENTVGDKMVEEQSKAGPTDPEKSTDRINKLKELSYKLKTPSGVSDLENEPAYMRRNVKLDDVPHSSKSEVSKFTLNENEEEDNKVELKPNNPFLHDNVD